MSIFDFHILRKNYDEGRPHFSPIVLEKLKKVVGNHTVFNSVADINCGTGESTLALRPMAKELIATDPAGAMIDLAVADPKITYKICPDTKLEVEDASRDFVLLQLTYHWLDRSAILKECHRILQPTGWLVMYQNAFSGEMHFRPEFEEWYTKVFLEKMEIPSRDTKPMTLDEAEDHGYDWIERERYTHDVAMTVEDLAQYLLSHYAASKPEYAELEEAEAQKKWDESKEWLIQELKPFFSKSSALFPFGGSIWYLRRKK